MGGQNRDVEFSFGKAFLSITRLHDYTITHQSRDLVMGLNLHQDNQVI